MMNTGTVAGVLSIFSKLIVKLEKIKAKQEKKEERHKLKSMEQLAKAKEAFDEVQAADKAIAKLQDFLD